MISVCLLKNLVGEHLQMVRFLYAQHHISDIFLVSSKQHQQYVIRPKYTLIRTDFSSFATQYFFYIVRIFVNITSFQCEKMTSI